MSQICYSLATGSHAWVKSRKKSTERNATVDTGKENLPDEDGVGEALLLPALAKGEHELPGALF